MVADEADDSGPTIGILDAPGAIARDKEMSVSSEACLMCFFFAERPSKWTLPL